MGPGVAREQPVERGDRRAEERGRDPDRRRDPDAIAIARDVLDREPAVVARDPRPDRAAGTLQFGQPRTGGRGAALGPGGDLVG